MLTKTQLKIRKIKQSKEGIWRQQNRKPKKQKGLMKISLSNVIFWCCSDHETETRNKARKEYEQKEQRKKQGRIKNNQRRKKKRDWKGEVKETRVKERETLKNQERYPFFRGNFFFWRKEREKKKEGLGPNAPKYGCRVHWPQPQEENAEKRKTRKEEEGSLKRSSWYWRKRFRNKNLKKRKEPSAP